MLHQVILVGSLWDVLLRLERLVRSVAIVVDEWNKQEKKNVNKTLAFDESEKVQSKMI